ncbi:hypothetical protein L9F63_027452, partial [Diploptera punctata]
SKCINNYFFGLAEDENDISFFQSPNRSQIFRRQPLAEVIRLLNSQEYTGMQNFLISTVKYAKKWLVIPRSVQFVLHYIIVIKLLILLIYYYTYMKSSVQNLSAELVIKAVVKRFAFVHAICHSNV